MTNASTNVLDSGRGKCMHVHTPRVEHVQSPHTMACAITRAILRKHVPACSTWVAARRSKILSMGKHSCHVHDLAGQAHASSACQLEWPCLQSTSPTRASAGSPLTMTGSG